MPADTSSAVLGRFPKIPAIFRWEHGDALQEQGSTDSSRTTANFQLRALFFGWFCLEMGAGDKPTLSEEETLQPERRRHSSPGPPRPPRPPRGHPHGRALPGPAHPGQPAAATSGTWTSRRKTKNWRRRRRRTGTAARPATPAPPPPAEPGAQPGSGRRGREMDPFPVSFPGVCVRDGPQRGSARPNPAQGRESCRGLGALQPGARLAPLGTALLRSTLRS